MTLLESHHDYFAVAALLISSGLIFWVCAQSYLSGITQQIADVNYRIQLQQEIDAAIVEDEREEAIKGVDCW